MSDHYTGVLLENLETKIDLILEGQSTMAKSSELKELKDQVTSVENDVKLIFKIASDESKATRQHTSTLTDHEIRITDLEDEDNLEYA